MRKYPPSFRGMEAVEASNPEHELRLFGFSQVGGRGSKMNYTA
jgi:hypothetical protein